MVYNNCRAAAAALMMSEDLHKFGRSRLERNDFSLNSPVMVNPASRQIYLTFPADSTFREEDVSNYFRLLLLRFSCNFSFDWDHCA